MVSEAGWQFLYSQSYGRTAFSSFAAKGRLSLLPMHTALIVWATIVVCIGPFPVIWGLQLGRMMSQ